MDYFRHINIVSICFYENFLYIYSTLDFGVAVGEDGMCHSSEGQQFSDVSMFLSLDTIDML